MIEVLVGNIASGKSTWTRERAMQGALVVSDDAIVTAVHGGVNNLWDKKLKPLYMAHELTTLIYAHAIGRPIVIDRTSMDRKSRSRWIYLAKSLDAQVVCIEFPIEDPQTHATRRYRHDSRGYTWDQWMKVATKMQNVYQKPELSEGFDNIVTIEMAKQMLAEGMWGT